VENTSGARGTGESRFGITIMKTTLGVFYKYSGLLRAHEVLRSCAGRNSLVVLVFHRVTDEIPEDGLTISSQRFRALCAMLARCFHVVPLGEIFRLARSRAASPPRTLAITFDDCYRDNLEAAHVLAEHGLPATFFLPTAYVGTDHVFPWDRCLKRMPNLTWDDVLKMQGLGFEIGSHTVTHADLGSISAEQAAHEIIESKAVLEDRLGTRVRWFAYPFGGIKNFHKDWLHLLEQAGYEGCVSAYGGFIHPGTATEVLPRECITGFRSNLLIEIYLTGCLNWYYQVKQKLGLREIYQAPCGLTPLGNLAFPAECHSPSLLEKGLH
jgi:peptidoglycan/xylan/chitin deacetylase (PgdA/CDA1 family)